MSLLKTILLLIWQFPQTIVGVILGRFIYKCTIRETYRGKSIFYFQQDLKLRLSGCSLGEVIILNENCDKLSKDHEFGHSVQSRILGPFYLLVVGLPSAVFNNLWDRLFHKNWDYKKRKKWYYGRYPEKWADKLGGVERNF
jgi:hypothetical protein